MLCAYQIHQMSLQFFVFYAFFIFLSPISVAPKNAIKIVLASCVLRNYLRTESANRYTPPGFCDVESTETGQLRAADWRNDNNIFEPLVE